MRTFDLFWAPEGRRIATVQARTPRAAIRKAPKPYRRYLGEIYTEEILQVCQSCGVVHTADHQCEPITWSY